MVSPCTVLELKNTLEILVEQLVSGWAAGYLIRISGFLPAHRLGQGSAHSDTGSPVFNRFYSWKWISYSIAMTNTIT